MKKLSATVLCFVVLATDLALAKPLGTPRQLSDAEKAIIVRSPESGLKDPDAAKYQWMKYNGYRYYCGRINAKNSYGGYIGYSNFRIDVQKDEQGQIIGASNPDIISPSDGHASLMNMICEISAKSDSEDQTTPPSEP